MQNVNKLGLSCVELNWLWLKLNLLNLVTLFCMGGGKFVLTLKSKVDICNDILRNRKKKKKKQKKEKKV